MNKLKLFLVLVGVTLPVLVHSDEGPPLRTGSWPAQTAEDQDEELEQLIYVLIEAAADGRPANEEHGVDPEELFANIHGEAHGVAKKLRGGGSSSGVARGDFNGDGFGDLAIGVPGKNSPSTVANSGAVIVIYGSSNGLAAPTTAGGIPQSQFWSQNTTGVPGISEVGDRFGSALAAGDFNRDNFSDLAIGAPGEKLVNDGRGVVGTVTVIYGSSNGLASAAGPNRPSAQLFAVNDLDDDGQLLGLLADDEDAIANGFSFGAALAWGDFNGDSIGDLAIGAPQETVEGPFNAIGLRTFASGGAVGILYGTLNNGLSALGSQVFTQNTPGIAEATENGDDFGAVLAAGNFNSDTNTDLAIGAPREGIVRRLNAVGDVNFEDVGVVHIIFGSTDGLTAAGDVFITPISVARDTRFGGALAAGDFNGDGLAELAVGAPQADVEGPGGVTATDGGSVSVFFDISSDTASLRNSFTQSEVFGTNDLFFGSVSESGDQFGFSLAAGDFNGDGRADLAIGVPFEDVLVDRGDFFENVSNAGEVNVIYGPIFGPLSSGVRAPQIWRQSTINIADNAEQGDLFGFSLSAWNFGRDQIVSGTLRRTADLAIGVPYEDLSVLDAGAVNVIYGSITVNGLTSANDQFWTQDTEGVPGASVAGDRFGQAVY